MNNFLKKSKRMNSGNPTFNLLSPENNREKDGFPQVREGFE
jgi:hypothetical protein